MGHMMADGGSVLGGWGLVLVVVLVGGGKGVRAVQTG